MKKAHILSSVLVPITLAIAACSQGTSGESNSAGGRQSSDGGSQESGGTTAGSGGAASSGGITGSGGVTGNRGSAGATASGGATSANGGTTTATGGTTSPSGGARTGGATGVGGTTAATGGTTSPSGGARTGGATASGGTTTSTGGTTAASGGARTGGTTGAGGGSGSGGATGTSVSVSPTCKVPTWPTPTGSTVTISGTKSVTDYDGKGALHEGDLNDCTKGDQDSSKAILEVANGGSVKNVIFGKNIGDGIHCLGSCTIENVWFPYICDDAITINRESQASGTSTIKNSGFKYARDKTIQHNGGDSTLNIDSVYVETAGKLYRSCGEGGGCTSSAKHTVNISNVIAIGVGQVAGVSENDRATLTNICAFRSPILCSTYKPGSDSDSTTGANGTNEGPSPSCSYKPSDAHALVDRVAGVTLTTDVLCPGSNAVKTGDSATSCITGFDTCLKACAPGMYGFKQVSCDGGKYTGPDVGGCALVTGQADSDAATNLAGSRAATASSSVTKNASCTTQWALGKDSSKSTNTCACVMKPGYYGQSSGYAPPVSWMVWDCQAQWW
jgi:hypothetical protein